MKLEDALNELLQMFLIDVFIGGNHNDGQKNLQLSMVLDDDKMHWNGSPTANHHTFLQSTCHIHDNHPGFVCHHAVLSASSLLLAFKFDQKSDS
jgi:hypothetical protein